MRLRYQTVEHPQPEMWYFLAQSSSIWHTPAPLISHWVLISMVRCGSNHVVLPSFYVLVIMGVLNDGPLRLG